MPRNSVSAPYASIARPASVHRRDVARENVEIAPPSGPAAAVVLAAGFASFALGLFSVLAAASERVSSVLTLSARVGDISGVTTAAAGVFVATWAVLAIGWRHADPPLVRVAVAAAALIALGLLGTFPPFFNAIGG